MLQARIASIAAMTGLLTTITSSAIAQQIAEEMQVLKAEYVSAEIRSLPDDWTGGQSGLSLIFNTRSTLEVSLSDLAQEHRDAARSICRKVGAALVTKNKLRPGLENLRFFVVQMKRTTLSLGPVQGNWTVGLVFDATEDCAEIR